MIYSVSTKNSDKKNDETHIFKHPSVVNKSFNEYDIKTL